MPYASISVFFPNIISVHLDSLTLAMPPCCGSTCQDLEWGNLYWVPVWQSNQMGVIRMHETAPLPILFDEIQYSIGRLRDLLQFQPFYSPSHIGTQAE